MRSFTGSAALLGVMAWALQATPAEAYIGPGAGLGAVALLVALVAGVVLLLAGLVWYPLKIFLAKRRDSRGAAGDKGSHPG